MRTLDWPDEKKQQQANKIITESTYNPFGVASYNPNEQVTDFVGREEELERFKQQIRTVVDHQVCRAVRLEGPAGVGKSTLFNYLKESVQKERAEINSISKYIAKESDVLSTYFQVPDKIMDFQDIWKPMFDGLRSNFEEEIGYDISFPEYLVLKMVYKFFELKPDVIAEIIWSKGNKPFNYRAATLKDIFDPLYEGGKESVVKLQDFWTKNKRFLRKNLIFKSDGINFDISRSDNQKILDLFRVIDEDDPEDYLDLILDADKVLFGTNEELITYFNDLMRYYACVSEKKPLFLIGIDEAAKSTSQLSQEYYHGLGNLFVKFRNNLNHILFVFISTTEDWAQYDEVIKSLTDLNSQISDFMYNMVLKQLEVQQLIQVLKNRMDRFWRNFSSERPLSAMYYPFSEQSFEYFYRYNLRDLRKTIRFLNEIWVKFRFLSNIPSLKTFFDCMSSIHLFDNRRNFNPETFQSFEWKIISNVFHSKIEFQSNQARSSIIEKGVEDAWRAIMNVSNSYITNVENNKTIKTSSGSRRPDVFIEISGNLGGEYRRRIEFQIKAYKDDSYIELKHIESSLQLFQEQYIDMVYFIITGRGLNQDAERMILKIEQEYPNRIRRPPLNNKQKNVLYFLALFEEIIGEKIFANPKYLSIAEYCLSLLVSKNIYNFINEIKLLAYRKPLLDKDIENEIGKRSEEKVSGIIYDELDKKKPSKIEGQKSIDGLVSFSKIGNNVDDSLNENPIINHSKSNPEAQSITIQHTDEDISQKLIKKMNENKPKWCKQYSFLEAYFPELCGLAQYMKKRETGRYAWKFTTSTVEKNIVEKDAGLNKGKFKSLVKLLKAKNYLEKEKTSYLFTDLGKKLYTAIKLSGYRCN